LFSSGRVLLKALELRRLYSTPSAGHLLAMASFDINTFFNSLNRKLEPEIQDHLKLVYATVSMALLAAALGGYVHLYTTLLSGGILSLLGSIGFAVALFATRDDGKNRNTRLSYLMGFAVCAGLNMGPLLNMAILVNPALIPTAFLSTCVIFVCFSLATIFSNQRKWLFLGGTLFSMLSLLTFLSLINIFIGSQFLFQTYLYLGFLVVCGFIMYDTSLIIEKRRMGETDYILHSVLLFIDFIDVFRHLLIILTQKENEKKRKRNQ